MKIILVSFVIVLTLELVSANREKRDTCRNDAGFSAYTYQDGCDLIQCLCGPGGACTRIDNVCGGGYQQQGGYQQGYQQQGQGYPQQGQGYQQQGGYPQQGQGYQQQGGYPQQGQGYQQQGNGYGNQGYDEYQRGSVSEEEKQLSRTARDYAMRISERTRCCGY